LDRLDRERDAKEKAERKAYGEGGEEKTEEKTEEPAGDDMTFGNFKVEIRRGPAPDANRSATNKTADSAAMKALQVASKLNAQLRTRTPSTVDGVKKDPDATDFHAIIPINDYPQKARWRVTNKETMVQV
jgi:ATP-dependent RNA helicase DDX46/PRP5